MKILPSDIITRREHGQDVIWISERLIEASATYHRKVRSQYKGKRLGEITADTGKAWRWAKFNGQYYYDYNRIPDRAPSFYRSNLPVKEEITRTANTSLRQTEADQEDLFLSEITGTVKNQVNSKDAIYFTFQASVKFSPAVAQQMAEARAWLNHIREIFNNEDYRNYGLKASRFWELLCDHIRNLNIEVLKANTPGSLRKKVLYEWPDKDMDAQRAHLIGNRFGNQNARVIGASKVVNPETGEIMEFDIHEALIYHAWMNPGKANKLHKTGDVSVYSWYAKECEEYGYDPVSESAVAFYLRRFPNRARMSLERDGHDHFNSTYKPYIPAYKPKYTSSVWVADFSGTKLLYRYSKQSWSKDGKRKVQKWVTGSGYLLRIVDSATDCIAGWHFIDSGEDLQSILVGLKNAVEKNNGYAARELVTDNGPAFTSGEGKKRLAMLFEKHRCIQLGNKQANRAELYVRLLSDKARMFNNWSMLGFHSTHADNQANPDYLDMNELPTQAQVLTQITELIDSWNNSPRPDGTIPAVEFAKQDRRNVELEPVSAHVRRYVFGNHRKKILDHCRGFLNLQEAGSAYEYEFPNWEQDAITIDKALYGSNDMQVKVVFDRSGADIYTPDEKYILTCQPLSKAHSTFAEATDETHAALADLTANKQRFESEAMRFTNQVLETIDVAQTHQRGGYQHGGVPLVAELTYMQRSALNGGRAKEDHNAVHTALKIEKKQSTANDIDNDFLNQL